MLIVDNDKLSAILRLFEIDDEILSAKELLRWDCDADKQDEDDNEISGVNEDIAYKTGAVLAAAHNISEKFDCHVPNRVIFDPFTGNDLFDFEEFRKTEPELPEESLILFRIICESYDKKMKLLEPLKGRARYAVQGDISDCTPIYATTAASVYSTTTAAKTAFFSVTLSCRAGLKRI